MECLKTLSPKRPDENRVKITHNWSQNTNGIFSSIFWSQSWSKNFFSHTNNLFKILQAKKISSCSSKRLAELTIQILQNMRNKLSFNSLYDNVAKNPRKRKLPNYSTIHLVDGTTSEAQDFHLTTCQYRYRVVY